MNVDKNLKEEIMKLEKELKELNEINQKLQKQKKSMTENNDFLLSDIENKRLEILAYNKELSNLTKHGAQTLKDKDEQNKENIKIVQKESSSQDNFLLVKENTIFKYLLSIQKAYNQSLQIKLKQNIDSLTSLQKEMRVNYIIIKKLDISEEFLKSYGLKEELK